MNYLDSMMSRFSAFLQREREKREAEEAAERMTMAMNTEYIRHLDPQKAPWDKDKAS